MSLVNMTSIPSISTAVYVPPIPMQFAINPQMLCPAIKQSLENYVSEQFWGLCKENVCHLGARHWISYLAKEIGCTFTLNSVDNLGGSLDIQGSEVSFSVTKDGDKFNASSDFANHVKAQWAFQKPKHNYKIGEDGFIYKTTESEPIAGSINLLKGKEGDKEFVELSIENEGQRMGGRCYLGSNFIECEAKDRGFVEKLLGGKIRATYSKEVKEEGVEVQKFDLEMVSSIPFLSRKLGSFYVEMDSKTGQFLIKGDVSKMFSGEISCSNNQESCEGQAKIFNAKIEASASQKVFPKEIDSSQHIGQLSLNMTDISSSKKLLGVKAAYEDLRFSNDSCSSNQHSAKAEIETENQKIGAAVSGMLSTSGCELGRKIEETFSAEVTDIPTQEKLLESTITCKNQNSFQECVLSHTQKDGSELYYYAKVPV